MIAASILIAPDALFDPIAPPCRAGRRKRQGAVQRLPRSTSCRQPFDAAVTRWMLLSTLFTKLPLRFSLGVNHGIARLPRQYLPIAAVAHRTFVHLTMHAVPILIVDFLLFGNPILNQRIYGGAEMFAPDKQSVSEVLVVGVECKYGVFIHQNILLDVGVCNSIRGSDEG